MKEFAHYYPHLGGGFVEDREQFAHFVQPPDDHDYQSLEEELLGVELGASTGAVWWRGRDTIYEAYQLDKSTVLGDHKPTSEKDVLGHTSSSEAFCFGSSPKTQHSQLMTGPHLVMQTRAELVRTTAE